MLQILLILIYSAIFCLMISKFGLFKLKDLSGLFICSAFLIKISCGILYGYLHQFYFVGGDTVDYFTASGQISATFFSYPSYYFKSWLWMNPELPAQNVFVYPEWHFIKKDFGSYLLVHIHAIPQFFSFGFYNVHIVFVALLSLIASLNFYKALRDTINLPKVFLIFSCFFMPSVLFWTSGLHKDVWVYFGISLLLLGLRKFVLFNKLYTLEIISGLILISLFRYYLLPLVIPGLLAVIWSKKDKRFSPFLKFVTVYGFFIASVFILELLGFFPFLEMLSVRQQEFLSETGNSAVEGVPPLMPTISSLVFQLPRAILNVCFRPFIWGCQDALQYIAAVEIIIFWFFVVLSLPKRKTERKVNLISYFIFFYAAINLLLIGLLVSNVGTIVRYRSIALSLLFVVVLQAFDLIKLGLRKRQLNKNASFDSSGKKDVAIESRLKI